MKSSGLSREAREDARLVRECRAGSERAFEALIGRHQDQVFNVACRMVGDREEALDLAQETFIKAFQGLGDFKEEMPFRAWLMRICTNSAIDLLRRRCRRFQMMLHGLFVKIFSVQFLNMESIFGTFSETGAETVAILFRRQAGLAVDNLNGAFRTGGDALTAAVTFFFIDPYNLAFDFHDALLFVLSEFSARPSTSPASLRPPIVKNDFSIMSASFFSFTGSSFSSRFVIRSAS